MSQSTPGCYAFTMRLTLDLFRLLLISLAGWLNQHQRDVIDYLQEENCVLREQLVGKRLLVGSRTGAILVTRHNSVRL